jgi:hypothetical protein
MVGHRVAGSAYLMTGRFAEARAAYEDLFSLYDDGSDGRLAYDTGRDPKVAACVFQGICLTVRGHFDQGAACAPGRRLTANSLTSCHPTGYVSRQPETRMVQTCQNGRPMTTNHGTSKNSALVSASDRASRQRRCSRHISVRGCRLLSNRRWCSDSIRSGCFPLIQALPDLDHVPPQQLMHSSDRMIGDAF